MKLATVLLGACLLALVLTACSSQQYDQGFWHQNFVSFLYSNVGKKFESVRGGETGGWAQDQYLIDQIELPNGNTAFKYHYQATCRYTFEVDPKTGIIVAARWEGEAKHCIIIP